MSRRSKQDQYFECRVAQKDGMKRGENKRWEDYMRKRTEHKGGLRTLLCHGEEGAGRQSGRRKVWTRGRGVGMVGGGLGMFGVFGWLDTTTNVTMSKSNITTQYYYTTQKLQSLNSTSKWVNISVSGNKLKQFLENISMYKSAYFCAVYQILHFLSFVLLPVLKRWDSKCRNRNQKSDWDDNSWFWFSFEHNFEIIFSKRLSMHRPWQKM